MSYKFLIFIPLLVTFSTPSTDYYNYLKYISGLGATAGLIWGGYKVRSSYVDWKTKCGPIDSKYEQDINNIKPLTVELVKEQVNKLTNKPHTEQFNNRYKLTQKYLTTYPQSIFLKFNYLRSNTYKTALRNASYTPTMLQEEIGRLDNKINKLNNMPYNYLD